MSSPPQRPITAFAPGRANLIGEHTDYNDGLSLPFAIEQGVRVLARPSAGGDDILVRALDLDQQQRFPLAPGEPDPSGSWTDYVLGTIAELRRAGNRLVPAELEISGDVAQAGGLSSSAALEGAVVLALLAVSGLEEPADRIELAKLCSRVENDWVGSRTGLLDQLASLLGTADHALRIDFRTLEVQPVPMRLGDWRLVIVPSGEEHTLAAGSGYEQRRRECEQARERLGLASLRDATTEDLAALPDPLDRRVRHVIEENARVETAVAALMGGNTETIGPLLDASHASLRDLYDASTDAVEAAIARVKRDGAAGARMMGGGFGGHVLALLPPDVEPPAGATVVSPSDGARLISD